MITTYQIRNVLRVYGNQLKRKGSLLQDSVVPAPKPADLVDISIDARRRQTLNKISNDLISQIPPQGHRLKAEGDAIVDHPPQNLEGGGYGTTNNEEQP